MAVSSAAYDYAFGRGMAVPFAAYGDASSAIPRDPRGDSRRGMAGRRLGDSCFKIAMPLRGVCGRAV